MSTEYILLVLGVTAIVLICRYAEKRLLGNSRKKENRRSPRQYEESEPEDLATKYHK